MLCLRAIARLLHATHAKSAIGHCLRVGQISCHGTQKGILKPAAQPKPGRPSGDSVAACQLQDHVRVPGTNPSGQRAVAGEPLLLPPPQPLLLLLPSPHTVLRPLITIVCGARGPTHSGWGSATCQKNFPTSGRFWIVTECSLSTAHCQHSSLLSAVFLFKIVPNVCFVYFC